MMPNKMKKAILTAGIAAMSVLPMKGMAQQEGSGDNVKTKNQTELKFGYDKKEFKKALKATKFFGYNSKDYNSGRDHTALAEYLATDTAMLTALAEEFILINEQLLNKSIQVGDTVWFVSDKPQIPGITQQRPIFEGHIFEMAVTKNNKDMIIQEKKDDALDHWASKIRNEFYHSAILDQKVWGEQMMSLINEAKYLLSDKLDNFYLKQKQQEIIRKHKLQNCKD
jgi:nitrogen regulatory protein PII